MEPFDLVRQFDSQAVKQHRLVLVGSRHATHHQSRTGRAVGLPRGQQHVGALDHREFFHQRTRSIAQATGAEFSVIPAQNASGNWVKVTQRIPVRIALDIGADDPPLRAGMSAVIDIDTRYVRTSPGLLSFLVRKPAPLPEAVAGRD